jgi:hypothetical protein
VHWRVDNEEKSLASAWNQNPVGQSIASHFTDLSAPANLVFINYKYVYDIKMDPF